MTLHISEENLSELWEEWGSLLDSCVQPTVFQTPIWHQLWWDEFSGDAKLHLLAAREDGKLVGVAPFMSCDDGRLMFVGDEDLWDYHKLVVDGSKSEEFYHALFSYLTEAEWSTMDLRSLLETSSTYQKFVEMARASAYTVELIEEDVSPGVALPGDWNEYLAALSKKDRHELRRKMRRLETQTSFDYYSVSGAASTNGSLDDFFALMRGSRQDKAMFLTSERERFFRRMASEMAKAGFLKLFFMEMDGERVAAALCFDIGNVRYLYNSGFNPEFGSLSVGLLLKAMCLRDAIESGMDYFDFLRGNERYKYDLGAKDVTLYRMVVRR